MGNIGVHQTHCCIIHGCKYGQKDCPVTNAEVKQTYLCEDCDDYFIPVREGKHIPTPQEKVDKRFIELKRNLQLKKLI